MERLLRPERFDSDPSSSAAPQEWRHWFMTFENFLGALPQENQNKLSLLINFISPRIYETISECTTYNSAIDNLKSQYMKPTNAVFARHRLATRRQQSAESLDEYLQALKSLSKDCVFKAVTATQHCEESIRDAFISGLQSSLIRQRLLENKTLDLATAVDQARALDSAQKNSDLYSATHGLYSKVGQTPEHTSRRLAAWAPLPTDCQGSEIPRPHSLTTMARKKGHFAKVCRATSTTTTASAATTVSDDRVTLASVTSAATPGVLSKAVAKITINGTEVEGLIDSGSSDSFIHPDIVKRYALSVHHSQCAVSMATSTLSAQTSGYCQVNLNVNGRDYHEMRLAIGYFLSCVHM
ncbi:hypothetical protein Pcinc_015388 [Petrolisthes cinctipes]|uniref:Uncharacterized protein n=1 Tax=Petrolisthes cinctipes TaxID=88211 RepID=A0AAE1KS95_PETCI|nr:hypothetical protein Pcinc_015388 [Petrolisthes cinctipes]